MDAVASWRFSQGNGNGYVFSRTLPDGTRYVAEVRPCACGHGTPLISALTVEPPSDVALRGAALDELEKVVGDTCDHFTRRNRAVALICGFEPGAPVRGGRGRRGSRWSDDRLAGLVEVVLQRQDDGEATPDDLTATPLGLKPRTVRELLAKAESVGLVAIEREVGHRNTYRRPGRQGS